MIELLCFVAPLILLIVLRFVGRFSLGMSAILFFVAPLLGALVFDGFWEWSREHDLYPDPLMIFIYPYAILFFGLWSAFVGGAAWHSFWRIRFFRDMDPLLRIFIGIGLGAVIGPAVAFSLWLLFSMDPSWPFDSILTDAYTRWSVLSEGFLAGAISGGIVASYLDAEPAIWSWRAFRKESDYFIQRMRELI
jgi:hypothetical protein